MSGSSADSKERRVDVGQRAYFFFSARVQCTTAVMGVDAAGPVGVPRKLFGSEARSRAGNSSVGVRGQMWNHSTRCIVRQLNGLAGPSPF